MQTFAELLRSFGQLFIWFVIVLPWDQCVRIRLGKHTTLLGPGIHLKIPYADQVFGQCCRRRIKIIPSQTVTTKDGIVITLSGAVGFSVEDVAKLYNTLIHVDDTIEAEVCGLVSEYVASNPYDNCQPPAIEQFVREKLRLADYGLGGQEFYLTNFAKTRTLRLITGEIKQWQSGNGISINKQQGDDS
jgi:hypothetical protein